MKALLAADCRSLGVNLITAVIAVKLIKDEPDDGWDDGAALLLTGAALGMLYWAYTHG